MDFSLKDSFLKTINTILFNYNPTIATATVGSSYRFFIFIDGSNFYHSLINSFKTASVDIEKFCKDITQTGELIEIKYYTSPVLRSNNPNAYSSQQKFLSKIKEIKNLTLFLGRLEKHGNTFVEKGVDVKIATDLISNAFHNNYDIAILVSNDSDFVPAIQEAQKFGKQVWDINFPKRKSYHLNQICNKTITLNTIKQYLVKK